MFSISMHSSGSTDVARDWNSQEDWWPITSPQMRRLPKAADLKAVQFQTRNARATHEALLAFNSAQFLGPDLGDESLEDGEE